MMYVKLAHAWLSLAVALVWGVVLWRRRKVAMFTYPNVALFGHQSFDWRQTIAKLLKYGMVFSLLIALSRPQLINVAEVRAEGIDIIIALDISGSMLASDFPPNRMEAAKKVIRRFIEALRQKQRGDRLGVVVFASESYTQCPLTDDYDFLLNAVSQILSARDNFMQDGTAIGDGLMIALARLRESPAKNKAIILLSDGENNAGRIHPLTAAKFAKDEGVRIYTVGIGTVKGYMSWADPLFGRTRQTKIVGFDEALLRKISNTTSGSYFFAKDPKSFNAILRQILRLETVPLIVKKEMKVSELAVWFIAVGLICLLSDSLLVHALWRKVP